MPTVDSQALDRVEYSPGERALFVRFASGAWYAYLDVAPLTYSRLLAAESKGGFFQAEVRSHYDFVRLDPLAGSPLSRR